jgi:hypothetical protein
VAAATLSMARSIAGEAIWLAVDTAATFLTYWRAAETTSSDVAGGSSPRSGVMFRHMVPTIRAVQTLDRTAPYPCQQTPYPRGLSMVRRHRKARPRMTPTRSTPAPR